MIWFDKYMDIPFKDHGRGFDGCDCWGLVRLIYQEEKGINLPSYEGGYACTTERDTLSDIIETEKHGVKWFSEIKEGKLEPFDVVILKSKGKPCHLGIMVDKNQILHTEHGTGPLVTEINRPHVRPRVMEVWRHE